METATAIIAAFEARQTAFENAQHRFFEPVSSTYDGELYHVTDHLRYKDNCRAFAIEAWKIIFPPEKFAALYKAGWTSRRNLPDLTGIQMRPMHNLAEDWRTEYSWWPSDCQLSRYVESTGAAYPRTWDQASNNLEIIKEERALSLIASDVMTASEAERIIYLWGALAVSTNATDSPWPTKQDIVERELGMVFRSMQEDTRRSIIDPTRPSRNRAAVPSSRLSTLARAVFNIPVSFMRQRYQHAHSVRFHRWNAKFDVPYQYQFILQARLRIVQLDRDGSLPREKRNLVLGLLEEIALEVAKDVMNGDAWDIVYEEDDIEGILIQQPQDARRVVLSELEYRNAQHMNRQLLDQIANDLRLRQRIIGTLLEAIPLDVVPIDDRSCGICAEPYIGLEAGDKDYLSGFEELPVKLPCGHIFGEKCIEAWLQNNPTCGFCRRDYQDQFPPDTIDTTDQHLERIPIIHSPEFFSRLHNWVDLQDMPFFDHSDEDERNDEIERRGGYEVTRNVSLTDFLHLSIKEMRYAQVVMTDAFELSVMQELRLRMWTEGHEIAEALVLLP